MYYLFAMSLPPTYLALKVPMHEPTIPVHCGHNSYDDFPLSESDCSFDPINEVAYLPDAKFVAKLSASGGHTEWREESIAFTEHVRSLQEPDPKHCAEGRWAAILLSRFAGFGNQLAALARVATSYWNANISIISPREAVHKVSTGQCGSGYTCNFRNLSRTCPIDDLMEQQVPIGRFEECWETCPSNGPGAYIPGGYTRDVACRNGMIEECENDHPDVWNGRGKVHPDVWNGRGPGGSSLRQEALAATYLLGGSSWSVDVAKILDKAPRPRLGVHIRHGDSCNQDFHPGGDFERVCVPTETYAAVAAFLAARYGMKSIYLTSDDPKAMTVFKEYIHSRGLHIPVAWLEHDRSKYDTKTIIDGRHDLDWPEVQNETAKDLWALASSDVLLGTGASNIFVQSLHMANVQHGYWVPYVSLETSVKRARAWILGAKTEQLDMQSEVGSGKAFMGCSVSNSTWSTGPQEKRVIRCAGTVNNLMNAFPAIKAYVRPELFADRRAHTQ